MGTKKWCVKDARLYDSPGGNRQGRFITYKRVYDASEDQTVHNGQTWSQITFIDRQGVEIKGWVEDVYLEELHEDPASQGFEVVIPNPTVDSTDGAQYLKWEKSRHVNMCGELCVAFIGGDDIETFLTKWKQMDRSLYRFAVPQDDPTGPDLVDNMLKVYGYQGPNTRFKDGIEDSHIGSRMSPGRFQGRLATQYLIAGVRIDKFAGNVGEGSVGHWVVLDKVSPAGVDRGWVEIYNPFPNKRQTYSYSEFIQSCEAGDWTGIWVDRTPPSPGG
jgi:hypothetical protein